METQTQIESYRQGDVLVFRDKSKQGERRTTPRPAAESPQVAPVEIGEQAKQIVATLAQVERANPVIDREAATLAFTKHMTALGLPAMPVRWMDDATTACQAVVAKAWSAARSAAWSAAWSAARSAARSAAESAAWSAAWSAAESEEVKAACAKMVAIWLPFADAFAAGLWLFWVTEDEVIAVPRPSIHIVGEQLHSPTGPAVYWPNGEKFYFWRGLQVAEDVIIHPDQITIERITKEQNAELRRVLIDRFGAEKYLRAIGAKMLHEDHFGKLYSAARSGDDPIVMVEVENKSPEPDGSFKKYMLRVHPELRPMLDGGLFGEPQTMTAHNAVASTFGLRGQDYQPTIET